MEHAYVGNFLATHLPISLSLPDTGAPSEDIPFYWPQNYYHPSSRVAIEYDLTSKFLFLLNNTGNRTEDFTSYMYSRSALSIPGKPNERSLKLYMRERRVGDDVPEDEVLNLAVHEGPTVILVKTAEFSTTVRSARATATSRSSYRGGYDSDDDDDDRPRLSSGAIVGVVFGSIIGFALLLFCCCKGCCGANKGKPARPTMAKEEKDRIVREGLELMEQRKAPAVDVQDGMARAEEGRGDVPPPKYTP
jgi:hypothetical protein